MKILSLGLYVSCSTAKLRYIRKIFGNFLAAFCRSSEQLFPAFNYPGFLQPPLESVSKEGHRFDFITLMNSHRFHKVFGRSRSKANLDQIASD